MPAQWTEDGDANGVCDARARSPGAFLRDRKASLSDMLDSFASLIEDETM